MNSNFKKIIIFLLVFCFLTSNAYAKEQISKDEQNTRLNFENISETFSPEAQNTKKVSNKKKNHKKFRFIKHDKKQKNTDNGEKTAVQTKENNQSQIKEKKLNNESVFKKLFSKNKKDENELQIVNEVPATEGNEVYDIDQCIKIGIKNSPNIKNLIYTKNAQKHYINSEKSAYFPVLNAGAGYNYSYARYSGNGFETKGTTTRNGFGVDLGLSAMIFDFGRTIAKVNMQKYSYESAKYDLDDGILNTVFDIKVAYTKVLSERANTDVLLQNVKINELNVERTQAMYEVGLKSKIDLVNAQVNLTNAEIKLIEGQKNYQAALINLNSEMTYMNAPTYSIKPTETFNFNKNDKIKNEINVAYEKKSYGKEDFDLAIKEGSIFTTGIEKNSVINSYKLNPFELTLNEVLNKAFQNRYDLKSMKLVKKVSEESLKAIKRSYYPQLNISGSYGLGVNAHSLNDKAGNVSNSIGLYGGLDFPSINAMYIKNQIDIAKINVNKAQNNIDALIANIYFDVQDLFVNMKQLEQKIPLMRQSVEQSLENFELADGRYAVGMGDYIELQQALTDYNNAQLSFIKTVFEYNQARFELERAMAIEYVYNK